MPAKKTPKASTGSLRESLYDPPPSHPNLFTGTSGWAYPSWKPGFYPAPLKPKQFLSFYASRLNSVEVNYTFRALPKPATVQEWLSLTPTNFRFSFKAPQRITHFNRLVDCAAPLTDFLSAIEPVRLTGKLGVVLFQLPPNFAANLSRLDAFLALPALRSDNRPPIAFEFRHESWFQPSIYQILSRGNAALCVAESDDLRTPEVHPAPHLACFRLRRSGGYTSEEIASFASRFTALAATHQVYAYLKHEDEPTGALNAAALLEAAAASHSAEAALPGHEV